MIPISDLECKPYEWSMWKVHSTGSGVVGGGGGGGGGEGGETRSGTEKRFSHNLQSGHRA